MPLKINSVVGGASINKQQLQLEKGTDILVATPGRLLDLVARKAIGLTTVRYLVLDEADQMLDLGFVHDLRKIAKMVPARRQTLLFSATMPKAIADLAGDYLKDPVKIEVTPPGKAADKIEQYVHFVAGKNDKTELLKTSLVENPDGRAIVFLRTKHGAEKLSKHLEAYRLRSRLHPRQQEPGPARARAEGLPRWRYPRTRGNRRCRPRHRYPRVTHVFNYDLPEVPDAYVHRIGRTARAGRDGVAIAFCAPDETRLLRDIEKLMGIDITVASGERPAGLNSPVRSSGKPARNGGGRSEGNREGAGRNRAEHVHRAVLARRKAKPWPNAQALVAESATARLATSATKTSAASAVAKEAPRFEADNDLVDTSDFGQARKKQFGPKPGAADNRKRGNGGENRHAPHAPHEPAQQRQARNGQQPRKPSGNGGPVKFGGEGRNGGNQPRRRDRA